ncbi:hypothetical protein BpHYR1_015626 [Brachionus plicatilis]|uniref:Uncharacterized protein n=1 Tax=Brachionus plicatilis TaxID=10195 RepID=A0A3M7RHI6_BRAPC|nr:hypothetical protein BpHYR1_015626 [Brachionus plicatilis]
MALSSSSLSWLVIAWCWELVIPVLWLSSSSIQGDKTGKSVKRLLSCSHERFVFLYFVFTIIIYITKNKETITESTGKNGATKSLFFYLCHVELIFFVFFLSKLINMLII